MASIMLLASATPVPAMSERSAMVNGCANDRKADCDVYSGLECLVAQRCHSAVSGGAKTLVKTTLEATSKVALCAAFEYSLFAAATSIGTAAALPAVAEAAIPAVPLPPMSLSTTMSTTAERDIVKSPSSNPSSPAVHTR